MNKEKFKKKIKLILKNKSKKKFNEKNQSQTVNFFSKHHNETFYNYTTSVEQMEHHWPKRKKYLKKYLSKEGLFLDVGCGGGGIGKSFLKNFESKTNYIGVDMSKNLNKIEKNGYLNTCLIKSLIEDVKFKNNTFDLILCHGVLHHIKNYKKSLNKICSILKKKGILFLTINKTLPFILNVNTRAIKYKVHKMPQSSLLIKNITELGKSISKIKKKVIISKNLKYLNIKKGKYDIQYLIHYYIFRNFYKSNWPYKASLNQNRDWYYPSVSHNFSLKEIENLFKKNKLIILESYSTSPSGQSYILKKT